MGALQHLWRALRRQDYWLWSCRWTMYTAAPLFVFAALPPAVFNYLLADRYERSDGDVAAMVLISHVLSLVFLPLGLAIALRA